MDNNSKHLYISIDANIIRDLTVLEPYFSSKVNFSIDDFADPIIRKNGKDLLFLLDLITKDDRYRLLVTTTPFYEVSHRKPELKFIEKYCYIPKPANIIDEQSYQQKI